MLSPEKLFAVKCRHRYRATAGKVFDAWLDPRLVRGWFGPGLGETLEADIDARAGGKFRIVQVREGSPVGHSGTYTELNRPKHLAFTWTTDDDDGSSLVDIRLVEGEGTVVATLVHYIDPRWRDYAGQVRRSWETMMAEMDHLLQQGQVA